MFDIIHSDGCTTNLGIIGAECNCGAEAQKKHTLKQVIEWGNEDCPHLWIDDNGVCVTNKKHSCDVCWAELSQTIEGEKKEVTK